MGGQQQSLIRTDQDNPICGCQCCDHIVNNNIIIFNIVFFQFTAMVFYSYGVVSSGGYVNPQTFLLVILCLFISYCWCARFSGTFLNPSIVVARLFVKQNRMSPALAPIYIAIQFLGAITGALLAWYISDSPLLAPAISQLTFLQTVVVFGKQLLGTFIYVIAFLNIASPDTSFAEIQIQAWFAIPFLLTTLGVMLNLPMGFNPSFGLAFQLSWSIYQNQYSTMPVLWAIIVGPLIGAVLGGFVYEFAYRTILKTHQVQVLIQEKNNNQQQDITKDLESIKREFIQQLA